MTLQEINKLPEIATSPLRELAWAIDHWQRCYTEARYQSEIAWKMYGDAIDNEDEPDEINALFEVATMFDANRTAAWYEWQNAKRDYLARIN